MRAAFVVVLQVGSSSAYFETLSQVREVAERVAAAESGSPMDERGQVMTKAVETLSFEEGCVCAQKRETASLLSQARIVRVQTVFGTAYLAAYSSCACFVAATTRIRKLVVCWGLAQKWVRDLSRPF